MRPVTTPSSPALPTWAIGLAGAAALAVAMGIGRFVFTPLLPLMQREGLLSADGGALLAAANYLGYLLGALTAARLPVSPRALVLGALLGTALLTAATGWCSGLPAWLLLRLGAGVLSAWALVGVGSWAMPALALRGRADAGGWVFAGVGLGITLAGGWVWLFAAQPTPQLWLQLGALALLLSAVVLWAWRPAPAPAPQPAARPGPSALPGLPNLPHLPSLPSLPTGSWALVLCYGTLGFGYILPATYLPALARGLIDDPRVFGLVWPAFGLAAAASTLLAGRALRRWHGQRIWAVSHVLMAAGCVLPLLTQAGAGLTLSALCVGGTFMVVTMVGLQQARALAPLNPAPLLARMTAAFACGQIAGPLVALLLARLPVDFPTLGWSGVELTLALAALALLSSAGWLHRANLNTPLETADAPTPIARAG